jgi:hypothetical protein
MNENQINKIMYGENDGYYIWLNVTAYFDLKLILEKNFKKPSKKFIYNAVDAEKNRLDLNLDEEYRERIILNLMMRYRIQPFQNDFRNEDLKFFKPC